MGKSQIYRESTENDNMNNVVRKQREKEYINIVGPSFNMFKSGVY